MFDRILVVCIGNVCRSPVAEAMLRHRLPDLHIESAGLAALVGEGVDVTARELAEEAGYDVGSHKARQLSAKMVREADIVLVMSEGQRRAVGDIDPASTGKTMLIGRWLEEKTKDIPDPYKKSREAFQHVHDLLEKATKSWAKKLV
ncbi:low molecular weight phosphotyrosine protein phosphatase [Pistricoccus aurantiacus]|uniref:protein-tyrosine-phosphatase n=1 Tax=Pistricoccus aurantiacus TaxID=1883414 RepID=A0A5B8SY32_9GAMM|nr:low molecular weight protein-tyrosine-phosphatase [Pistricoccus aurantiacus]QEA39730.1 low molecular weight phosphotyrosine protein phosphatase [Pistricoccus aurantiacus]